MSQDALWVFGYGSLIWRPDIPFVQRVPARLHGWIRRFYQGSPDHRGTMTSLGRVVTLLRQEKSYCDGMAYHVAQKDREAVLHYLDVRECGGYERCVVEVSLRGGGTQRALFYIATKDNPHYLGEQSPAEMAKHIVHAKGASGTNLDYFLHLREAIAKFAPPDPHIEEIYREVVPFLGD